MSGRSKVGCDWRTSRACRKATSGVLHSRKTVRVCSSTFKPQAEDESTEFGSVVCRNFLGLNHQYEQSSKTNSSELVKREVSRIVLELNLSGCGFVTITAAEIAPDLKRRPDLCCERDRGLRNRSNERWHYWTANMAISNAECAPRRSEIHTQAQVCVDETEYRASHIEGLLDEIEGAPATEPSNKLPSRCRTLFWCSHITRRIWPVPLDHNSPWCFC